MIIEYTDSLLLQSVYFTHNSDKDFNVRDMIAYSDYVNHAIITYQEFSSGLLKLLALGLIGIAGKQIHTTEKFNSWKRKKTGNKKSINHQKEIEEINQFLKANNGDIDLEIKNQCRLVKI